MVVVGLQYKPGFTWDLWNTRFVVGNVQVKGTLTRWLAVPGSMSFVDKGTYWSSNLG